MRDWQSWHDAYRDPGSDLSQRLAVVQRGIRDWANRQPPGPARLLSMCAGQGHDVVGALRDHPRRNDVRGLLVELDRDNVAAAHDALRAAGLDAVHAVVGDAGHASAYAGAEPADLVLVCGVFGNVPDEDVRRTVAALPSLCAPGGTVIWTRHRREPDLTPSIRSWFVQAGFEELAFESPGPNRYAVGIARAGSWVATQPDDRLFTFVN